MKLNYGKQAYLILNKQPLAGTSFVNWIKILIDNKFKVDWQFIPKALYVSIMVLAATPLRYFERRKYDKKINDIVIKAPIFIIGHWRSGTTFMHYLLGKDKNLGYSSTMQTLDPSVFLNNEELLRKIVANSLPNKRPMDNLEMQADLPYEDEYAIANLSPYSFYHAWYFPRSIDEYLKKYILHEGLTKETIDNWKEVYSYFLKKLTYYYKGKQIMLKSLVNTAKIKILLEMYPDAKFVHLSRNPYEVYMSTWKLYNSILPDFSFQHVDKDDFDKSILEIYKQIYKKYLEERKLIPRENLIELTYEDFTKEPLRTIEMIYTQFNISSFKSAKPAFKKYIKSHENYIKNNYELTDDIKAKVAKEWGFAFKEFAYQK